MRSVLGLVLVVVLSIAVSAQLPTATLNGTVTDPQGALVAGARVTIVSQATGAVRDTTTDTAETAPLASVAVGESIEKKKPDEMRIAASGTPIRTAQSNELGSTAASASTWQISDRITMTPAWACPARKKFWRSGLSMYRCPWSSARSAENIHRTESLGR
jgi:hypothetical protein